MTQRPQPAPPAPRPQVTPDPAGAEHHPGETGWIPEETGMPPWLEAAFPWMVSFTLHLGLLLLVVALFYFGSKPKRNADDEKELPVIPTAENVEMENMRPNKNPGANDPTREAAQNKFQDMASDGWAQTPSDTPSADVFAGSEGTVVDIIGAGTGGSVGAGTGGNGAGDGGKLARYGMPGGGSGPGPRFFGVKGRAATKIVYVLDHSGSMIDTFDFLRDEVKKQLQRLTPAQKFAVVMFSEQVDELFPKGATSLVGAVPEVRRDLVNFVDNVRAAGKNDDLYEPFAKALQKAFSLQPQVVYFLTDGNFDPKIVDEVKRLNVGKKAQVHTIAFIKVSRESEEALRTIATDNGGIFKYVKESDLGR